MDISVQTGDIVVDFGYELGAKMIRQAGFTAVDWNIDHALSPQALKNATALKDICIFEKSFDEVLAYYEPQLKAFRDNGLKITQAHAPFPPYLPGREDVLDYCIGIYSRAIELCDAAGCKNLIVHGISRLTVEETKPYEYYKELNYRLYRGLIPALKKTNVTVCLENLFKSHSQRKGTTTYYEGTCSDPHEAVEYIDTLNAEAGREDAFGFCLDVGHLHILRKRFANYVPVVGKRIKCLHIHDNDGTSDEHMLPYTGTLMWEEFLTSMHEIGYDGDLSFETFRQTSVKNTAPELAPVFLETIYKIGLFFRSRIQG